VALKKNKTVNALCNLDIDMGYKNIYGTDLLLLAVKKMNFQATSLFVQKGMNIDVFDENKMTPLHYAVLNKDEKSCFLLIENKAKVNVQNIYGQTPLMLAAERGLTKIAAALIEHRADVLLKDGRGYRPFDYYCKYKAILKKTTKLSERTRGE
jgi:ankyrin repeat protein